MKDESYVLHMHEAINVMRSNYKTISETHLHYLYSLLMHSHAL